MKRICFLTIILFGSFCFAQGEANNWYFGQNAGITFNTNPPSALLDGQINTNEGCSSISDANGELLMYTDGRTVWNRMHQIMPNANYFEGSGLNGDPSSTSSGLIVPHPTNADLYFVFTIDEPHHENAYAYPNQGPANSSGNSIPVYTDTNIGIPEADDGFNNGLSYSIVDLTLDGGLGDVIPGQRNMELITYNINDSEEVKYKASEKITAIRGRDCNSIWVITHFRNKFYAFLIGSEGLDEEPVISTVEPLLDIGNYRRAAIGYLKASPNADKLLIAHNTTNFDAEEGNSDEGDGNVYIYDFDNLTGLVSNPIELISNTNAYGVEFSQDGTKVYASVGTDTALINQWDLKAEDIRTSMVTIASVGNTNTALQLGPDGRIFHSIIGSSILGVINEPNQAGAESGYTQNIAEGAIDLNDRSAVFGLPPFIQSLFSERIPIIDSPEEQVIEQIALCDTYNYMLGYEDIPGASYQWSKNGEVLPEETNFFLNISIDENQEFPIENNYRLEVDLNNGECPLVGIARIIFNKSPNYDNVELKACRNPSTGITEYDLSEVYTLLSMNSDISEDKITGKFYESESDALAGINPLERVSNFLNTLELTKVYAIINTFDACEELVEISLLVEEFPDLIFQDETFILCLEDTEGLVLDASTDDNETDLDYLWNTGETTPEILINSGGDYVVNVNISGFECTLTKTFTVIESSLAEFDYNVESSGNTNIIEILVNESSLGDYEFALKEPVNFQDSNVFENLKTGVYQIFVRDKLGCGISKKTIGVLGIMDFFTPNGDGINDVWQISGLLDNDQEQINLQVFDRYGKLIAAFTNKDRGWDGTYNGKNMPIDDYWYRIQFSDGTLETGNFTLKR